VKRIIIIIIDVVMTLSFVACGNTTKKPVMYIEKAQLSEQEENIAKLLGANSEQLIYDFESDDNVKSLQVNTYELIDGAWELISGGGGQAFSDNKGRLALDFKNLAEGLRVALQSEHDSGSTQYSTESTEDYTGMANVTSILNDLNEITYEQEIPLVVQILTTKNSVSSYNIEYFFSPDEYEKHGYEHIYAITILFSQKTVGELDTIN
jgi:hypothetical protein